MFSWVVEVQYSKDGEPFSEFLAQQEWWVERKKRLKNRQGILSLLKTQPCIPLLCLCLSHPFHQDCSHPNPNNWSLQVPVQTSFLHALVDLYVYEKELFSSVLSSYSVPDNLLRPLHAISHLIFQTTLAYIIVILFCK